MCFKYNGVMRTRLQVVARCCTIVMLAAGGLFADEPGSGKNPGRQKKQPTARPGRVTWDFQQDLKTQPGSNNPQADLLGFDSVWHLLRTTRSKGPVGTRRWLRDGRYALLTQRGDRLFAAPLQAWTFKLGPALAPFAGRYTAPQNVGIHFQAGETVIAPGPDHAIVIGWRSPVAGRLEISGEFHHAQNCCGKNSQINWYVERGPAPDLEHGFKPLSLARGHADFGTATEHGRFRIGDLEVVPGDFVYFIADCVADGTGEPHHGDATRLVAKLTVVGAKVPDPPSYEKDIRPLLSRYCVDCHGQQSREARLDLRSLAGILSGGESGPVIVRRKPGASFLVQLVESGEMPPKGEKKLSAAERGVIRRWILAGAASKEDLGDVPPLALVSAEDRKHWAFRKPVRQRLPEVTAGGRVRSPIDRFLLGRLESDGLEFAADADRATLLRRACLDLLGLPPSLQQQQAFLNDIRPGAYSRLLDRLLAHPQYGERWGRHWMDAAGYVDVRLFDGDAATIYLNEGMWQYRDYCISAHNQDLPWDQFITEQLAGDELVAWDTLKQWTPEVRQKLIATGFLRNIEDPTSEAQYGVKERYDVLFDLMKTVSSSLLGLTLECARCHSHKYDPIPQRDFYRFMACFEPALNVHSWKKPQDRWLPDVSATERSRIDEHNASLTAQTRELTSKLKAAEKAGKQEDQQKTIAELKNRIQALGRARRSYGKIQALWDVGPDSPSRVLRRGQWNKPGAPVVPGFLEVLSDGPAELAVRPDHARPGSSGRRLSLARWLTRPDHPLTARVIVNRAWHHHFGAGIVTTPGNFGRNGAAPSHPKLLDWLAVDFVEHGWSLKHLHRRIMLSTAYRQASFRAPAFEARAVTVDAKNRLLWRANLKRIEAEAVRDSVLAVAGNLDPHPGGPPVMLTKPPSGLSLVQPGPRPTSRNRRSIYLLARRVYPLKFLEIFDSPVVPINCTKRPQSATVLQSLALLNSQFVVDQAGVLAERVHREVGDNRVSQVRRAYRLTLAREPAGDELSACRRFLDDQASDVAGNNALRDLCQMLLCTNEFLFVQ
jgi:hypothetical protein